MADAIMTGDKNGQTCIHLAHSNESARNEDDRNCHAMNLEEEKEEADRRKTTTTGPRGPRAEFDDMGKAVDGTGRGEAMKYSQTTCTLGWRKRTPGFHKANWATNPKVNSAQ